jgi:hypothetical protein
MILVGLHTGEHKKGISVEETKRMPPRRMLLKDVGRYVRAHYNGETVSRMTPYNWANIGIRGVKLRTMRRGWRIYTTAEWLDVFMASTYNYR